MLLIPQPILAPIGCETSSPSPLDRFHALPCAESRCMIALPGGLMPLQPRTCVVFLLMVLVLAAATSGSAGDYYKLENVKRVEQDLYRSGNLYIETKYCYHYTYGETAVLKWDGPYGDNKIIWDDDSACQVKNFFKK